MMQQPGMTPQGIDIALAQLDTQAEQLEALQEAQAAGAMMPQQMTPQMMPQQAAPIAPMQYSPFPPGAMQQRSPLGSYLLLGAVVAAGLYLFNKSYKVDITKTVRQD